MTVEVEVTVETGTYEGGWKFANRATCDQDAAVYTARILWDESDTSLQGQRRRITWSATDDETGVTVDRMTETRP